MVKDDAYWQAITDEAKRRGSDGCTVVKDFHQVCCYEHDIHWNGTRLDGTPISRAQANREFRQCIQSRSKLGRFSPLSWLRWVGVSAWSAIEKVAK